MDSDSMIPPRHRFVKAVVQTLAARCGISPGNRLVLAVSGGVDSVALLEVMAHLGARRKWRLTLAVGHVQHHLRDDAEADAVFVEQLAGRLGLPYFREDVHIEKSGNIEAAARHARYGALETMARKFDASAVVTAHHGDDQLETLLMRLMRGSGLTGLNCMSWRRRLSPESSVWLLRPMLGVDRAMACAFLNEIGQDWREDHTNEDTTRLRALVRKQVMPALKQAGPAVVERAADTIEQLQQVHRFLDQTADEALRRCIFSSGSSLILDRKEVGALPAAVACEVLRKALFSCGASADGVRARQIQSLRKIASDGRGHCRQLSFGDGVRVKVTCSQFIFSHATES